MNQLDFSHIKTKDELMNELGIFFSLPNWWGHNWDAFRDCIDDNSLSSLPLEIHIIGFENIQKTLPEDVRIFQEILDESSIEYTLLPFLNQK